MLKFFKYPIENKRVFFLSLVKEVGWKV